MLALFPKAALGRFLVSYDVPTDAQGQFQRALSALKRYWGRAAIYAVSEARVSEEWGKLRARRAIRPGLILCNQ